MQLGQDNLVQSNISANLGNHFQRFVSFRLILFNSNQGSDNLIVTQTRFNILKY